MTKASRRIGRRDGARIGTAVPGPKPTREHITCAGSGVSKAPISRSSPKLVTYDYLLHATALGGAFIGVLLLIALWHTKPKP